MGRVLAAAMGLALVGGANAWAGADQPLYQPPAPWVKAIPIPAQVKGSGAAMQTLLWTSQSHLAPGDDESFVEQAFRIDAPEGLQQADKLTLVWNPLTDVLTIHRACILRGGQVIDLLAGGKRFTVLRRETNLEAAMIDGELTATLQPEGVQVGDVIDLAYTLARHEPALAGHSEAAAVVAHAGSVGRLYVRAAWPAAARFGVWKTDDLPALTRSTENGWTAVAFDQLDAVSPLPPKGAAPYDLLFGMVQVSDFQGWPQVSAASYPLYTRAATLQPDSPLHAEIARIRAAHPDAKGRALAALELVENQTRYLYVGLDAGGFTPAAADLTWMRRFGDCKGKTVLLLALLKGLGIEAEPALVNTALGDGLDRIRPQMGAFDHVIVRATLDGRTYWLDATRMGDESLDALTTPNDHWALPVREGGAELVALRPEDPTLPIMESSLKVDLSSGADKPAKVHETLVLRRDVAWAMNTIFKQASAADRDRALRQSVSQQYSWITPDKLDFAYDPQRMEATVTVDGTGKPPFSSQANAPGEPRDWLIDSSNVGYSPDFARTAPYHKDAAYQVAYPMFARASVEVDLPDAGRDFEVENAEPVNETVAGMSYGRTAEVSGGRFTMVATSRALAPSFPASQAASAEDTLRRISEYPVSLRYSPAEAPQGSTAEDEARLSPTEQGEAAFARKDYPAAEKAFTAALADKPSAKLYYDRAASLAAHGQDKAAEKDLHAALFLDPGHALSLYALGRIELARGEDKAAADHFSQAVSASGHAARIVWPVFTAYQNSGRFAEATPYADELLQITPAPSPRPMLLNNACWVRAQWGRELDVALKDCDEADRLQPNQASYLDSRALVELRMGDDARALADYDRALLLRPKLATSLYGRGVVEARMGKADLTRADFAAAAKADAKTADEFAKWGVAPSGQVATAPHPPG